MTKIKEVLVVEGKDDTKRINEVLEADTIETRGSAISDETLMVIDELAQTRGIIIFTDPDFSGEKIRKIVSNHVPEAKHAFLKRNDAIPSHKGSLGVEHASNQAIIDALKNVYTENDDNVEVISQQDLIMAHLVGSKTAKTRRQALGEILKIGYVNGKQLQKRLKMFGITQAQFSNALKIINQNLGE